MVPPNFARLGKVRTLAGTFLCILFWLIGPRSVRAAALTNEFFAMDTGVHGDNLPTPASKAKLLKELGYAGIGWTPPAIPEMLAALDGEGLKMNTLYVGVHIGEGEQKYDPQLSAYIKLLKGRGTIIWLFITSKSNPPSSPDGDARAVEVVREIADMASASGLRVALYPHTRLWLERIQDAMRIVKKVDRSNVGVTFNLCHCLKVGDGGQIPALLREARPNLFVVTINGADPDGDWDRLIQPLDRGTFDLSGLLHTLREIDYTGPIGLQLYGVKGDARENLRRSMDAWLRLKSQ
jgi:sugar phosphate isomerase/epimerase